MSYRVSIPSKNIKGSIHLPSSKSISNRVLIIQQLCEKPFAINNLSSAKDTTTLQSILKEAKSKKEEANTLDVGDAGTTMRFLTAYLALQPKEYILTGSARMQERPIGILVDALRQLGASIEYVGKEGFPPLRIIGKELSGGEIQIDGSVSSQFISALLLIATTLQNGLKINFTSKIVSLPYIKMTLSIMEHFGIEATWGDNSINIHHQIYQAKDFTVEPDWSAASYWYEIAALAEDANIELLGLKRISAQGDAVVADMFESFGVTTTYTKHGIIINKSSNKLIEVINKQYHLIDNPDLAQTIAVTSAALNSAATLTGLDTLKLKETDRINALYYELNKLGIAVEQTDNSLRIYFSPALFLSDTAASICSYSDHRMAMAFAPLALKTKEIVIENPKVVSKSYPAFWEDLKKLGFVIEEIIT